MEQSAEETEKASETEPQTEVSKDASDGDGTQEQAPAVIGNDVSAIVEEAMPSVVAIHNKIIYESNNFFFGPQTYQAESSGSGIIVGQNDAELLIVTNNHVVEDLSLIHILIILPVILVVTSEHIGHQVVTSKIVGRDLLRDPGLHRSLFGDNFSTMISGLIGSVPTTTYGENIGVMAVTRVYSCLLYTSRENLGYFIDKYDKWSRYEPEVKGVMIAYASMYGNTEAAAQALAAKLCEKGITDVAVYDVSNTHVSYLISEAFKYSHIALASVTYNLGIYPVMKNFLEDMKALNMQNRTFALIENGSWACKSGDQMCIRDSF